MRPHGRRTDVTHGISELLIRRPEEMPCGLGLEHGVKQPWRLWVFSGHITLFLDSAGASSWSAIHVQRSQPEASQEPARSQPGASQEPARSQPGASQEPGASKGPVLILANALATDSKRRARRLIWVPASLVLSTE
jgi:hypothetical protein